MFYVYLWLRYNGTPYYAGKGKKYRAFQIHDNIRPPRTKDRILVEYFDSENDAFEAEKFLISYYGRLDIGTGCLRNLTSGGDGVAGRKYKPFTEERRINLSRKLTGITRSPETRAKMSAARKGIKHTPERCEKNRQARLGKKLPESTKQKMRESWTGYEVTAEHREARRQAARGNQNWRVREARKRGFM
jgi:hypothetical protein